MDSKHRKIIEVEPQETALIQRTIRIKENANRRAQEEAEEASKKAGRRLKTPMIFIEDPEEREIVQAGDRLAEKYRLDHNLSQTPILIPAANIPSYGSQEAIQPFRAYYQGSGKSLSQAELVEVFLERVPIRRQGDSLFIWAQNHFRRASDNTVKRLIGDVLREELRYTNKANMIASVLSLLQSESKIQAESEVFSHEIAAKNGTLDFCSFHFQEPNPRKFNTFFLDAYWYGDAPCHAFQSFLWSISGGNSLLSQRILEVFGFLLAPGNEAKRFVLFQGVPNSGKSVLGNLLQSFFLPGDVASVPLHQLGERFAMGSIEGRRLNLSMDLPSGIIDGRSASIIKQITGGDLVFVEKKGKEGCAKHIPCKFLFGTNHHIELKVRDEAFAQRILLIPFRISVPEGQRDIGLLDKLRQEKAGILYQSLAAYREVVRRNYCFSGEDEFGFKMQEIVLPTQPIESIRVFVEECCQLAADVFTTTEALHQAFLMFCQQMGLPSISDRPAFSRALKNLLGNRIEPVKKRVGGTPLNGYNGIKMRREP